MGGGGVHVVRVPLQAATSEGWQRVTLAGLGLGPGAGPPSAKALEAFLGLARAQGQSRRVGLGAAYHTAGAGSAAAGSAGACGGSAALRRGLRDLGAVLAAAARQEAGDGGGGSDGSGGGSGGGSPELPNLAAVALLVEGLPSYAQELADLAIAALEANEGGGCGELSKAA